MAIWSAEIKEIDALYKSLSGQLPDLEKELGKLIGIDDENMVLIYSRRSLEVIITDLCERELNRPRKTEPLKGIIDKLNKEEKIPSHIIASMQNLNNLSTFGAHPKEFDPEQVKPVLNNLTTIIKWYLKYKNIDIVVKKEEETDKTIPQDYLKEPVQPSKTDLWKITTLIKIAIPICVVAAGIVIVLYWDSIKQRVDDGNSRREIAQLHVEKAMSHIQLNYLDSAKMVLELALKSDSTYSNAWSSMAAVNYKQGKFDQAIIQTIKAIEYDPTNSLAAYNLAFNLEGKEFYDQAIQWYSKAIVIDSTFTEAYSALGNLHNKLNRPVDAILVLNKAKRITPESEYIFLIYKNLGNAYLLLEQYDEAIIHLEHSRYLNQNYPETIQFLAKAYEAAGMMDKSIEQWWNYIKVESDTSKIREAQEHVTEITIKHLQEINQ